MLTKSRGIKDLDFKLREVFLMKAKEAKQTSEFGERLKRCRQARGLTQGELAQKCGVSQRMVRHYESRAKFPPIDLLPKLAKALRVSTEELLGLKNFKDEDLARSRKLMRRFKIVESFPLRDQRMIFSMINTVKAKHTSKTHSKNGTN